jgi:hypothetical protein
MCHKWEIRNAYRIFVVEPKGKKRLRRPWRRWQDNGRTDLRETGWEGVNWMHLAPVRGQWRAVVNTVMNLRVP